MEKKDRINKILIQGCDERIFLRKETNANKYHLNPTEFEGLFHRGSCTCGTLTAEGYKCALEFLDNYEQQDYQNIIENQTSRLKGLLDSGKSDFDVFYGPSGSDMMYLPLLFQTLLHGEKEIINIVSCPEELGSGSNLAAEGRYYSEWNQFGQRIPMGDLVTKTVVSNVFSLPARKNSGHIEKRSYSIKKIISEHPNLPIVGNLVFGSKSGIKDDLKIIDEVPEEIMWVVDMCQFRADTELIHSLLDKGVLVMVTGSKFYQAPPFCGALLVPKIWSDLLMDKSVESLSGYENIFSSYDFPVRFKNLRKLMEDKKNPGLRMRWEIAIEEMEKYQSIPSDITNALIRRWNQVVTGRLAQSEYFRLMPNMELTNDSIVSFMALCNERPLDYDELKYLFDYLVLNHHDGLIGFKKLFLGQPVKYGNRSFIRLAIGSFSVRRLLEKPKFDPFNDLKLIEIIENSIDKLFNK